MSFSNQVLVIGAGIAGMEASLMLAKSGKKVFLVEKLSLIGGNVIKNEESFPNLECSTCMVAPIQQAVLQDPNIETMTLSTVEKIDGDVGHFEVSVLKKARYASMTDCIGCGMCYEPCPVSLSNEWEENLGEKKAIYVPTAGSLPNVPAIEAEHCLQLSGKKECNACVEACMFGAIDLSETDEQMQLEVGAILLATGSDLFDVSQLTQFGYGKYPSVYTSIEFERLFASNGPTLGEIKIRNSDRQPKAVAMIHCVGREEQGYCSGVCCMVSLKHAHFLKHKLGDVKLFNLYTDFCVPDKTHQKFQKNIIEETQSIFHTSMKDIKVTEADSVLNVAYIDAKGKEASLNVDMVILAPAIIPGKDTEVLSRIAGIETTEIGFLGLKSGGLSTVETAREGVFLAGCAEGPKDVQSSVTQAESAVGGMLARLSSLTS
ncbi:CoB--CoM heterodisulfide reductase iron-sulfur subunit A family protein [candidate division KSB1 bacterium]|nr:CoB--CoM heterodisulfide reductase iron-sulfur subunit A family protein [candidate division KSB1 bacterium]